MEFVVDKVSEDSFYENLLIGLPKVLEKLQNISDLCLERYSPVQHNVICAWEQKYGVLLPEDLRAFYASTNGLLYTYNFCYKEPNSEHDKITGKIEVNSMNDLSPICGYEIKPDPGVIIEGERYELKLGADSKVFELVNLNEMGKVCLVYINHRFQPTVWIHNAAMKLFFLADDFTTYLRMSVHHLGIPYWQMSFTSEGIPEWSEMVFRLLEPAVLPNHKRIEEMRRNHEEQLEEDPLDVGSYNKIDVNIFRTNRSQPSTISLSEPILSPKNKKNKPVKPCKLSGKIQKKLYQKK